MSARLIAIVALVLGAASACGDEGPPNPAPYDDGSGAGDSGGTPFEPPPKRELKRTIEMRNPLGGPPGNLLVDGDFEFSIDFEGTGPQSGWISTPTFEDFAQKNSAAD